MGINSIIINALSAIAPTSPDINGLGRTDAGELPKKYIVFAVETYPAAFGDNCARLEGYAVMIHYFCPLGENSLATRKSIKKALAVAGFTWPRVKNVTEAGGSDRKQHYIFTCGYIDGGDTFG